MSKMTEALNEPIRSKKDMEKEMSDAPSLKKGQITFSWGLLILGAAVLYALVELVMAILYYF